MPMTWCEPGTDATYDLAPYHYVNGNVSSASDHSHTGQRSLKLTTGSPGQQTVAVRDDVLPTAGRVAFWTRYEALPPPAIGYAWFMSVSNSHELDWLPDGRVRQRIGGQAVTGTAVTAQGQWQHICLSFVITSASVYEFRLYVNGVLDSIIDNVYTGLNLSAINSQWYFIIESVTDFSNAYWFDDIYIDTVSDLSYTGDIRVTAKRPVTNGGTNTFDTTTSTSNSGYGSGNAIYVNERPFATTGARRHNGSGTAAETFAIEGASVGDVDLTGATIVGRLAWVSGSGVAADTIYDEGTSAISSSGDLFNNNARYRFRASTTSVYPSSASAVGMGRPTGNATDAVLNEAGMLLAYLDPTTSTVRPISDVTVGTWTPSTGSSLYAMLNDASDSTYITSDVGASPNTCEVRLGPMTAPGSADVILRVRHRETP
jgi:hypothetical protein